ncbi:unnamed protein product [Peronospora destructor]|uniref:Transmembrane protein n=1 Tax=Peronospora destructor TaxID=86335 RepID=A0AAV0UFN8_9STRA|nr:unnamed protein product [Peronospora destructor]
MVGALTHLWHGSVVLLTWTMKLIHTFSRNRSTNLPNVVSSTSALSRQKNVWNFLTSGPRRARHQSHAALELLEKFRQGPATQSEWNLFLWRATFPLVSLVLLTLFCIVGQFGHAAYSIIVNSVWYLCNFVLVTSPFLLVFRFSIVDEDRSLVEWYMSLPASRFSWIVGNTLFGIVALGAVPLFFSIQPRTARSQYEDLVMEHEQDQRMHRVSEEEETFNAIQGVESSLDSYVDEYVRIKATTLVNERSGGKKSENETLRPSMNEQVQRQGLPVTRLICGCGFCALVLWLIMFLSYSSARGGEASTRSWFLLYLLSPILCIVLFCSHVGKVRFSLEHAVVYSALVVHVPLFLGHLCVRLFALAEDLSATSTTSSESWLKLAISVLYLLLMQGYFFVITHMVNSMSEPFEHPSLLYVGQLYYYVFWYILVGSDTPIDALYWSMLFLNNIHIAFLNTGIYTDFKRTSSVWLAIPLHATSSAAFCLCSKASAMDVSKCLPHNISSRRQRLLGLNCGVAGAAAMETNVNLLNISSDHNCEYDSGYDSDGFIVSQNVDDKESNIGELPFCQETGSRNRERDRNVNGIWTSDRDIASPARKTGIFKTPTICVECSHTQINCRKCISQTSRFSRFANDDKAHATFATKSFPWKAATSDALRPLYFLMKLAEQDNMADTTALILVPSLLTLLAVFEKPGNALSVLQDQTNLWLRCVCMFIGRLGGAFLAREIFTCKLRSRLRSPPEDLSKTARPDVISGSIDGMPARLWIQRLMLQDFHAQFWYLTAVTMVVTFGCFACIDMPLRFALLA